MVISSPYPSVDIPDVSVTDFVLGRAREFGDAPALIDGPSGRRMSYAELADLTERLAGGLAQRGLARGEVVALHSPNLPAYAPLFHGVARAGGVVTTVNPLSTVRELAFQLRDSGARLLVTVGALGDTALEAAREAGLEEVYSLDEAESIPSWTELMGEPGPGAAIEPGVDLLALPYSSGTTGHPKGVMLTHRNVVANLAQIEGHGEVSQVEQGEAVAGVLPFYHIYGLTLIVNFALRRGACVVTMPRFDFEEFLGLVQEHRMTFAHLVPPIILGLAKHPVVDRYDLSSLRGILSGAAPLDDGLAREAGRRLGCPVTQGYGLTETSPVTHVGPNTDPSRMKPGSVGFCLPDTEARIVDTENCRDLGRNQRGELWIRGPQVMRGYLGRPEATAESIDDDGWFRTGDIAYVDDHGYFYVVDRVKELIKYKGKQVAPAELESLLLTHPSIADAAVVPAPDEEAGEIPMAYVVKRDTISADEVMAHVAEQVSPHKKIRRVAFVEEIPKTASGKILRRVLVEREREREATG